MQVMMVNYNIRMALLGNRWLERQPRRRLAKWHSVARQSGLFNDPRCMQLLRAWKQEKARL